MTVHFFNKVTCNEPVTIDKTGPFTYNQFGETLRQLCIIVRRRNHNEIISQEKETPRDSLLLITIYWVNREINENVMDKEINWNI